MFQNIPILDFLSESKWLLCGGGKCSRSSSFCMKQGKIICARVKRSYFGECVRLTPQTRAKPKMPSHAERHD